MAQVLANMNVYMHPKEPFNPNLGETQSPGNYGSTRILSSSKDINCEVEIDTEAIQELENQFRDMLPVENNHEGLDTENICQEEEAETEVIRESDNQSGDTVLQEQSYGEQPGSLKTKAINETIRKPVTPQKRYRARMKLKKLRKEHQKLRKIVKRLRRKIKQITMGKVPKNTPKVVNVVVQMELFEDRATGTQNELIPTQTIVTQEGPHADLVDVATQMEVWTTYSKEVQT